MALDLPMPAWSMDRWRKYLTECSIVTALELVTRGVVDDRPGCDEFRQYDLMQVHWSPREWSLPWEVRAVLGSIEPLRKYSRFLNAKGAHVGPRDGDGTDRLTVVCGGVDDGPVAVVVLVDHWSSPHEFEVLSSKWVRIGFFMACPDRRGRPLLARACRGGGGLSTIGEEALSPLLDRFGHLVRAEFVAIPNDDQSEITEEIAHFVGL